MTSVVVSRVRRVLVVQPWPLYPVYTHPVAGYVHHRLLDENPSIGYPLVFSVDLNVKIACLVLWVFRKQISGFLNVAFLPRDSLLMRMLARKQQVLDPIWQVWILMGGFGAFLLVDLLCSRPICVCGL
jgi:hypothetical protein